VTAQIGNNYPVPLVANSALQGTEGDDTMHIRKVSDDTYAVSVNGECEYCTADQLKKMGIMDKQGNMHIRGGGGDDVIVIDESITANVFVDAGPGDDVVFGGSGNDYINGGSGNDYLNGRGGNDRLVGGSGDDMLDGAGGYNALSGGSGNDRLLGSLSNNMLDDGSGNDVFVNRDSGTAQQPAASCSPNVKVYDRSQSIFSPHNQEVRALQKQSGAKITNENVANAASLISAGLDQKLCGCGFKQTAPGTYTQSTNEFDIAYSQPGGPGTPIILNTTSNSGPHKGQCYTAEMKSDGSNSASFSDKNLNDLMKKAAIDGTDLAFSSTKKKKGGGSATTGAGEAAGASGNASEAGGANGLNGSGLDVTEGDMSESWFLTLAVGMGTIMNKLAERMVTLLNDIKNAGDDPPYKLTAEFQATAQQLSFMQQAFMAALNSLGESIKTGVTAGGAAR
jgi:hypothetical protein